MNYNKEGFVSSSGSVIQLVVGVGVAALVLIFIGTMAGQTYTLVEPDITKLADANVSLGGRGMDINIGTSVKSGIVSSFKAIETTGKYLPLIVLAIVISIILSLVVNMGSGADMGRGGAL